MQVEVGCEAEAACATDAAPPAPCPLMQIKQTALMKASEKGHTDLATLLVEKKANLDLQDKVSE